MSTESHRKSRSLETAVRFIQEIILESDPKLKGIGFTIETNKIETVSGVRHEIDVLVRTVPGSVYESTCIFECKNWEKPVGKNEVIVFAEKVEALCASHGYLVAKNITSDAEAQIAKKPRLKFVRFTEDFLSPFNSAELVHVAHSVLPPTVTLTWRGTPDPSRSQMLDPLTAMCRLNTKTLGLMEFVQSQLSQISRELRDVTPLPARFQGTHSINTTHLIHFRPDECAVEGIPVESITIPFFSFVTYRRAKIISKFELGDQGQVFAFEPIERDGAEKPLEIHIVTRF